MLDSLQCNKKDLLCRNLDDVAETTVPQKEITYITNISNNISYSVYKAAGAVSIGKAYELAPLADAELMRTRYCIRYELGLCPIHHHVKDSGPLFLVNNGRRLALHFDCRNCEMTVKLP
jgi:putative protease